MNYIKLFHNYINPPETVMMFGSIAGWLSQSATIALGAGIGFPAMIWTSILYGAGLSTSGTSIYETIIVGADVGIDFAGYVFAVNKAS
ncbi:MAG: hypothetical protein ACOC40_03080 [Thermoplasmatota archaeon]